MFVPSKYADRAIPCRLIVRRITARWAMARGFHADDERAGDSCECDALDAQDEIVLAGDVRYFAQHLPPVLTHKELLAKEFTEHIRGNRPECGADLIFFFSWNISRYVIKRSVYRRANRRRQAALVRNRLFLSVLLPLDGLDVG